LACHVTIAAQKSPKGACSQKFKEKNQVMSVMGGTWFGEKPQISASLLMTGCPEAEMYASLASSAENSQVPCGGPSVPARKDQRYWENYQK